MSFFKFRNIFFNDSSCNQWAREALATFRVINICQVTSRPLFVAIRYCFKILCIYTCIMYDTFKQKMYNYLFLKERNQMFLYNWIIPHSVYHKISEWNNIGINFGKTNSKSFILHVSRIYKLTGVTSYVWSSLL